MRTTGQQSAITIFRLATKEDANWVIKHSLYVEGKKVWGRRQTQEPKRCLKCDMQMALPKDLPTLEVSTTKNYTRVDNVFCLETLIDALISCNTFPQWQPQKIDHLPIISVLDIDPE